MMLHIIFTKNNFLLLQFTKEEGRVVEECKLRVLYVSPPRPPSPVAEGSDEGSSPKTTAMENGNLNGSEVDIIVNGLLYIKQVIMILACMTHTLVICSSVFDLCCRLLECLLIVMKIHQR